MSAPTTSTNATTDADRRPSALSDWDTLSAPFTNISAIRPRRSWFSSGLSERAGVKRVQKLAADPRAVRLSRGLAGRSHADILRLTTCARVNLEQAQAAFRVTVFTNVTIFLGAFLLFNQVFPGELAAALRSDDALLSIVTAFFAIGAAIATSIVAYGWGGVASARDLMHLLELHAAGMDDGRLETRRALPETGDAVSDLRSAQLSDL